MQTEAMRQRRPRLLLVEDDARLGPLADIPKTDRHIIETVRGAGYRLGQP